MSAKRKLRDEAIKAVAKGDWKKAEASYSAIAALEPNDATWPLKLGEIHKKLGRKSDAVRAFGRAVDLYSKAGFLLKAIAACKLILETDPGHTDMQAKIAALHAARGFPPKHAPPPSPRPEPAPPPAPAASPAAAEPPPASAELQLGDFIDIPLDELLPAATPPGGAPQPGALRKTVEIDEEPEPDLAAAPTAPGQVVRAVMPKTALFSELSERHLGMLIERVRLVRLEAGQTLFKQGDPGDALYVVVAGEMSMLVPDEIARLKAGSFFGEIALLASQARMATARAQVASELLAIDRATVTHLVADSPAVLSVLLRFLRGRLVDTLVETSPLFAPLTGADRARLVSRFRFLQTEAGVPLVEQGIRPGGFFILLAGTATVEINGQAVKTLSSGHHFGEMGLLEGGVARATIRTASRSFLLELPRAAFAEMIVTHPQILVYLDALAEARREEIGRLRLI